MKNMIKIKNIKQTSYEIICATVRYPPINAYFEFDPHLVKRNPYADKLIIEKIIITFILLVTYW